MRGWRLALALMWVGLVACDGGDSESPRVEREDFNAEVARAICEQLDRCVGIADMERCRENQLTWGFAKEHGLGTRYDTALEDGRVRYDAEAAAQCVEFLRDGACDEAPASPPVVMRGLEYDTRCRFLLGQVEVGGACQWTTECKDGTYCDALPASCGGVCQRGSAPEPVVASDACAPGTIFLSGRCLKPGGAGTNCGAEDGKLQGVCDAGTYCEQSQDSKRTCQRVKAEGAACDDSAGPQCGWPLFCGDGRCQKPRNEGEACKALGTASFGRMECRSGLFCDADSGQPGICRPRRDEAGVACRNPFECGQDMNCVGAGTQQGVLGTCHPSPRKGEPCGDLSCAMGLVCASVSRTCVPIARLGESCVDTNQCSRFGTCLDGVCRPPGAESCG
ncbi:EB domain-containing protein [Pyxidicoccus xibeiensis]|uniref:EB domain-containing protein n=1 Tax=Pyxidicoccus xibeiensis TaxID=2906759 RepID=UPI0020A7F789|nr:EB domain-containing protein [Pyxidicoccus xibeiensis]MCP3140507.1 EB domain-containing protein [Pyxidicoccus xibeiensis]